MGIEDLTQLEIVHGSTSLAYAIVGIITGVIIAYKGYKSQQKEILTVGISMTISRASLLSAGISFLTFILFDFILPDTLYFFITYGTSGFGLVIWMYAMSKFLFPKHTKKVVLLYTSTQILYETLLIISLFVAPIMTFKKEGLFDASCGPIVLLFVIYGFISLLVTMIWFIRDCLKSESLNTKWRGRLLLISTLLNISGILLDAIALTPVFLLVIRIILIVGFLINYFGWLLPKRVANWLIKENK
ncbi:MAG: hypothetical protein ACFFAN_04885 [Promethearchaeota archaeon]